MRENAKESIQGLSDNDTWLFQHMVTAFWHIFGLANGLSFKKEEIDVVHYREGGMGYCVKAEVMLGKLEEYLRRLEAYSEKWGTNQHTCTQYDRDEIYHPSYESRLAITKMIELLQI